VPGLVWLVVAVHTLTLAGYSLLLPAFHAPDEIQHLDMVLHVKEDLGWPHRDDSFLDQRMLAARRAAKFERNGPPLDARSAPPRSERPTLDELGTPGDSQGANNVWQHPPLYYLTMSLGLSAVSAWTPEAWWSYDRLLGFVRLLNVLLSAALPLLAALTAMHLTARRAIVVTAALVPLAVPQLHHIGSATNNDNLLILLLGALTVTTTGVLTGDRSRRTAVITGVLVGLGILTKGTALFALVWVPAAYLVAAMGQRTGNRAAMLRSGTLSLVVALLVGGWWWVRNVLSYGTLQPRRQWDSPPEGFVPDLMAWLGRLPRTYATSFWGRFGWLEVSLPDLLVWGLSLAMVTGIVLAVVRAPGRRASTLALLLPFAGLACILLPGTLLTYLQTGVLRGMQGRYFFPALVALAVLVALGYRGDAPPKSTEWFVGLVTWLVAACVHAIAVAAILRHYWGAPSRDAWSASIHALLAWAPWPRPAVVGLALFVVVAWLLLGAVLARSSAMARRPDGTRPERLA
jgi:small subunit ribosomal protein S36